MSTEPRKIIEIGGSPIRGTRDKFVSLTDIWRASGAIEDKRPAHWIHRHETRELVEGLLKKNSLDPHAIIFSLELDELAETRADWRIALDYAKWAAPAESARINKAITRWASADQADPLAAARAEKPVAGTPSVGVSAPRASGVEVRNRFVASLLARNCDSDGIAAATREVSVAATGQTPSEFRDQRGMPRSSSVRDQLTVAELQWTALAESDAVTAVRSSSATGNEAVVAVVREACAAVLAARLAYENAKAQQTEDPTAFAGSRSSTSQTNESTGVGRVVEQALEGELFF